MVCDWPGGCCDTKRGGHDGMLSEMGWKGLTTENMMYGVQWKSTL